MEDNITYPAASNEKSEAEMEANPYGRYLGHVDIAYYCQTWVVRHKRDTVEQLRQEIELIKRSFRPLTADDEFNRLARRDNAIGVALILVAQEMIDEKQNKPKRAELNESGKLKVNHKFKPQPRHESKHLPRPRTPEEQAEIDQFNAAYDHFVQRDAHQARIKSLREAFENDSNVAEIEKLQKKAKAKEGELESLLNDAEKKERAGWAGATDAQINAVLDEMISDMHEAQRLRGEVEKEHGVRIDLQGCGEDESDVWGDIDARSPAPGLGQVARAVDFATTRRVAAIGRKYGLGRQPLRPPGSGLPRRERDEMIRDLAAILSYERQRQLLPWANNDSGATNVILQILKVDRAQIEAELAKVRAEIRARGNNMSQKEIERRVGDLIGKLYGNVYDSASLGATPEGNSE